jgi:6-phosphogluconate dehydrogenase
MDIAIVGLGKMGGAMAQRLLKGGQRVVGLGQSPEVTRKLAGEHGLTAVFSMPEAVDLDVPAPIITLSLQQRFISRQTESYAAKLLAAMRNEFGGHAVRTKPE